MIKNKATENNYGTFTRNVQLKIDEIFAEKVIPANDKVRLLYQIVEELGKAPLERALKRNGRAHRTNSIAILLVQRMSPTLGFSDGFFTVRSNAAK